MTDLLYNIDSVEVAYGDNALNCVVQIQERITDISEYIQTHDEFNDFEKTQLEDRLTKLVDLNVKIQDELQDQIAKIGDIITKISTPVKVNPLR